MFNSLPHSLKEKIRSEYRLRLFIVVSMCVMIFQLIFLVLVFPSWLLSVDKEKDAINRAEKMDKGSLDQQILSINSGVELINNKINIINTALDYPQVTPLIDEILSKKGRNISIDNIVYNYFGEGVGIISLSGKGATRDSLVSFVKRLEESGLYKKVDLPISNFTKDRNLDFSISLSIEI